jgi:hypothetical protein
MCRLVLRDGLQYKRQLMKIFQLHVKNTELFQEIIQKSDFFSQINTAEKYLILCFAKKNKLEWQNKIDEIINFLPQSKIIGCSGSGEIAGEFIYDDEMIITLMSFKNSPFEIFKKSISAVSQSEEIGKELGKDLRAFGASAVLFFSDGLNVNGSKLVQGINDSLKNEVDMIGGMAGDGFDFQETWVLDGNKICTNTVIAVGIKGKIKLKSTSAGAWKPFGDIQHTITKSIDNIVFEFDNTPALALYKKYLGEEESKKLPASGLHFPVLVVEDGEAAGNSDSVIRTLLAVNEVDQSLTFAGDLAIGSKIKLMRFNPNEVLISTEKNFNIFDKIIDKTSGMVLSLVVSCVGRRLCLGQKTEEELSLLPEKYGKRIVQTGFYSYGEFAPSDKNIVTLHNQTLTQAILWEDEID